MREGSAHLQGGAADGNDTIAGNHMTFAADLVSSSTTLSLYCSAPCDLLHLLAQWPITCTRKLLRRYSGGA